MLAYSGGLDTSVLLKQFIVAGHRVVAMTLDLGESDGTAGAGADAAHAAVRAKALALGAYDAVLLDVRERFVADFCEPALRANALYEGVYPLSAALSRPLIAASLVETAHRYGADAVAHGCTGKGNDQVRIELAVRALDPSLETLAPLRDEPLSRPGRDRLRGRARRADRARRPPSRTPSMRICGAVRSKRACSKIRGPRRRKTRTRGRRVPTPVPPSPNGSRSDFDAGVPSFEGLHGAAMVAALNARAGAHGVGRIDLIEDRVIGVKSREVYECPGSTVLIAAHKALERLVLGRDELRFKATVDQKYAELAYDGLWPSPLRAAFDAFNAAFAPRMTGTVRVRLHRRQRGRRRHALAVRPLRRKARDVRRRRPFPARCGERVHRAVGLAARARRARRARPRCAPAP